MKKTLISLLTCLCASGVFANDDGSIFIRTLREESSAVKTDNKLDTLEVNETVSAKNVQIKCPATGFASFALSNRSAGVLKGDSCMMFTEFKHKSEIFNNINMEEEAVPSNVQIYLEKGELTISRAQPRPGSKFIINTPFGSFHCTGREIKVSVGENNASAYAYRAPFSFYPIDSKKAEYINTGYAISASKDGANISLSRASINNEDDSYVADFTSAENAWRNTMFEAGGEDNLMIGKRIVQKTFHLKRPIIPRKR